VNRWKERLTPAKIAALEALVGECLTETGYTLTMPESERRPGVREAWFRVVYRNYLDGKWWAKMNTPLGRLANLSALELSDAPETGNAPDVSGYPSWVNWSFVMPSWDGPPNYTGPPVQRGLGMPSGSTASSSGWTPLSRGSDGRFGLRRFSAKLNPTAFGTRRAFTHALPPSFGLRCARIPAQQRGFRPVSFFT
jgi:hypothetical protein